MLWRRLDCPGNEAAWLLRKDDRWLLTGTALFEHEQQPCGLQYRVDCDANWKTRSARVTGSVGGNAISCSIEVDAAGRWTRDGSACPDLLGCLDVDLSFSPSTNLLPIRRLGLRVGEEAEVAAAWLRFPSFSFEPLRQRYRRLGDSLYQYESGGGTFSATLQVNEVGFVTLYPDLWEAEAPSVESDVRR